MVVCVRLCAFAPLREIRWTGRNAHAKAQRRRRTGAHQFSVALIALALLNAGCSSDNALGTVPVGGKVTYKSQPVSGATITFLGEGDARTATAITAADGTYHLTTLDSPGAMPGSYAVLVEKIETPAELNRLVSMEEAAKNAAKPLPQPKKLLPAKYADATKTPLKFEVKKGRSNTFDLPLAD